MWDDGPRDRGPMRPSAGRQGSVLALAVLVLLALQLLSHGALLMARAEVASSRTGLRLLQARAAAEAGAARVLDGPFEPWDAMELLTYTPPVTGSLGPHPYLGRVQRLAREYWMAVGQGRSQGEVWGVTVRRLVWRLDPVARVAAAVGGAEAGGALPDPSVMSLDEEAPAFCHPWRAVLDSVSSADVWAGAARLPPSTVPSPSLGRLGAAELAALLPELDAAVVSPGPASSLGRCDHDAPWNWGDPADPGDPCADLMVARFAGGDLRVEGGVGQGILAVAGDLEVTGARFDGVILVGGSLTLGPGSEVRGLVRVGGDIRAVSGAYLRGSPCRALRALDRFRTSLAAPLPVKEVGLLEEAR